MYNLAPRPSPPSSPPIIKLDRGDTQEDNLLAGERGEGVGEEPNKTTTRKLGPLYIIQYSLERTVHPQNVKLQGVQLQDVQITKRPDYKTSRLQNVQLQNVQLQNFYTINYYETSSLENNLFQYWQICWFSPHLDVLELDVLWLDVW